MSIQEKPSTLNAQQAETSTPDNCVGDRNKPHIDLGNVYRVKYSVKDHPGGLYQILWCRIEKMLVYLWVFTQTLCLLVGLTVLHFTTFSAIICYLVNGVVRGRGELLPHKHWWQ